MSIPVWEVLEGAANGVEGQEHKPYNQLVNLSGQALDLVGIMRDCARVTREAYERRLKVSARNARSVPPQEADSITGTCAEIGPWPKIPHNWSVPTSEFSGTPFAATTRRCYLCGL